MSMNTHKTLTDAIIRDMQAGEREYTVRDKRVAGLGIKILPSGRQTWVLDTVVEGRHRRLTLGAFVYMNCDEARKLAMERLQSLYSAPSGDKAEKPQAAIPTFGDFAHDTWWPEYRRKCKPSTIRGTRSILNSTLLPAFGTANLDSITKAMVIEWFERKSRTAPGGANHALNTLGMIMGFAVERGLLKGNPARRIRKNPARKMTRFLSIEEMERLNAVMNKHEAAEPSMQPLCDIVRLLMLTGCRKGEIMGLRWDEVKADRLNLADSKTGARVVWLNEQAAEILSRQPKTGSAFVFPSPSTPDRPRGCVHTFWDFIRRQARLRDVRLHDLRHTFASHAVMQGIPLPVVARLLGHSNVSMTMRYAHISDAVTEEAAERIGFKIGQLIMEGDCNQPDLS